MNFHPSNMQGKDITSSIPWNPATLNSRPQAGNWVSRKEPNTNAPPEWVYQITETFQNKAYAKEFRKTTSASCIQATNGQNITIPVEGYALVKVLAQEGMGQHSVWPKSF
jgi:hypothetical protein